MQLVACDSSQMMYTLPIKRNEIFWLLTIFLFLHRNFIQIKVGLNIVCFNEIVYEGRIPLLQQQVESSL